MPELPEVETTRRGIEPYLVNQVIHEINIHHRGLRYEVTDAIKMMINEPILSVERRAKYLIIKTKKHQLIIHLGMSGSLRIEDQTHPLKKHDHLVFKINHQELRYHDPRRFGFVKLYHNNDEPDFLQKLAPEPLSDKFNAHYLYQLTQKKAIPIKSLIMDQKYVVGVGNIYANESLFLSHIHPERKANSLKKKQVENLVIHIKDVLKKAITEGGTTLKDFVNPEGTPGYFAQSLFVYGKENTPCEICKTALKKVIIAQRASFFCPKCQK